MSNKDTGSRLIVALDFASGDEAVKFAQRLDPALCRVKIGKELFTSAGPAVVEGFVKKGFDVFLDLKYHDIPNTVAKACAAARELGVWMMNVHTLGGAEMMQAAREALGSSGAGTPLLIGVTILTSHSQESIEAIGLSGPIESHVVRLAGLAQAAGLDGVVCSAREVTALRAALEPGFRLVTPGIRPASAATDDQKRVMTPYDAIKTGSDYLVVGRPVTTADDPLAVMEQINADIRQAL